MIIKGRTANLMNKQLCDKYSGKPFTNLPDKEYPIDEITARIDVDDIISTLPEKWQELCQQLKFFSPGEIAQMNIIPRSTLYHILQKLRVKFKDALVGIS